MQVGMSTGSEGSEATMIGRNAVAIAVTAAVSIVTLGLLTSGLPIFGPINDLTNAVGGLLTAVLVWRLHRALLRRGGAALPALVVTAWVGSAAIIVNSILVAAGRMHWMTGGMYTAIGYGLLGVWLLGRLRALAAAGLVTTGHRRLGGVAGGLMLLGLLAGPALGSGAALDTNPIVWVGFAGVTAGLLLYPLWCWLVGRRLLRPAGSG